MRLIFIVLATIICLASCDSKVSHEEEAQENFSLAMDTMSFSAEDGQSFDSINVLRMTAADSLFGVALNYDSVFIDAYYWRGVTRTKLNDYDGALSVLTTGIGYGELFGKDVKMLYMSRGVLQKKLGNDLESASDFRKALELYDSYLVSLDSTDGRVVGAVSNMVLLYSYLEEPGNANKLLENYQNDDPFYEDLKSQVDSIDLDIVVDRL